MVIDLKNLTRLTKKLLPRFIAFKLAEYEEPRKKGTPKGEPVGLSLTKYTATLYALRQKLLARDEGLAAQAKELNISYGVLRKWRSEPQFKELVAQHEKEFFAFALRAARDQSVVQGTELDLARAKARVNDLQQATLEIVNRAHLATAEAERSFERLSPGEKDTLRTLLLSAQAQASKNKERAKVMLENSIHILRDRTSAIKHRKEVVALLESVREALS